MVRLKTFAPRIFDPSTHALAVGFRSGFRPTGVVEGGTGLPAGLHLRSLARAIWLEKISALSFSHFENSQNLKLSARSLTLS